MTMAKHKARVPWWQLRRKHQELITEHQKLQRAYRELEQTWSAAEQERLRLSETYEIPTGTTWAAERAAAPAPVHDPDQTTEIRMLVVGVDPSAADPSGGITVFRTSETGTAEIVPSDPKEWRS